MASNIVQIIGLILGGIGMILSNIVTGMPQWRVSVIADGNIMGSEKRVEEHWITRWEGLWSTCVKQNNVLIQCSSYNSLGSLTPDLKAGRVFMSFAVGLTVLACVAALVGMLYNQCCKSYGKNCLLLTAGVTYILAALLVLIPLTWTASNIMQEVYGPLCKGALRVETGEAIFLGWPTVLFLFISGAIFCWFNPYTPGSWSYEIHESGVHEVCLVERRPSSFSSGI
ncbi:claudin-8 [Microcaecilia unicolor]|uniref:Claudin n=1 Tax=Microcaecilia unicolor TaxID=1415580 RepID=A0A6P7Y7P7_9AMPH|nr:claudin-8-like [Microcaecilia unicolor]